MTESILAGTKSQGSGTLLIEAFYGGSHRQLIDLLHREVPGCDMYTLPAKKWHWRARTSALYFSQAIPSDHNYKVLFCSSVLNLAELVALRQDLAELRKVVYFHENQITYPVRKNQDRDFQYGYNQILTCLVADVVIFNSIFNQESFLSGIQSFMKLMPDHRPKGLAEKIRPKCCVVYFPIQFPEHLKAAPRCASEDDTPGKESSQLSCGQNLRKSRKEGDLEATDEISGCVDNSHLDDEKIKSCVESKTDTLPEFDTSAICPDSSNNVLDPKCGTSSGYSGKSSQSSSPGLGSDLHTKPQSPTVEESSHIQPSPVRADIHLDTVSDVHSASLCIVWPHRWEHDKDPELLFRTLYILHDEGCKFRLMVMGETYTTIPDVFGEAVVRLKDHIVCWGYRQSKAEYYQMLQDAHVVISTAKHEFYGVAMLEAVYLGCYPLVPNDLVYPEIFPKECLYNTEIQLLKRLRQMCRRPSLLKPLQMDFLRYSWYGLKQTYTRLLTLVNNTEKHISHS